MQIMLRAVRKASLKHRGGINQTLIWFLPVVEVVYMYTEVVLCVTNVRLQ